MFNSKENKRKDYLFLALILALAAILRLLNLSIQSLWIDEINAVLLASRNIFRILFYGDTASPFIYLVNHFWQKLGTTDFMVRVPSLILGLISIWAIFKLARAFFSAKEALWSSFLVSISLYHTIYSQEAARPYTAFLLFSLLSLYCLYQMFKTTQRKYWVGFIIFNALNLYTHNFSIFVLVEEIIICTVFILCGLFKKRNNYRWGINKIFNFFLILIAILILSLPISIQFLSAARSEIAGGRVILNPIYYKNLLCRYGAGNGFPLFVYSFFFISGIISLFRGDRRKEIGLLIFWLVFPFFVLSFLELKHFFHIRYVIFTYPAYIIIVSKGITNFIDMKLLKPFKKMALVSIVVIFLALSFNPLSLYYQMPARLGDWKGAIEYVYSKADAGAFIITNPFHDTLLQYYLNKKPIPGKIHIVTQHNDESFFKDMLLDSTGRQLYYITSGNDQIKSVAEAYFENNKVFFPPVYERLGKRELIDWDDTSWFSISENRYRLVVYFNNQN